LSCRPHVGDQHQDVEATSASSANTNLVIQLTGPPFKAIVNMSKHGPIILVEDDVEDQEITREIIEQIGIKNELIIFSSCEECISYLLSMGSMQPFIILSDVNLPKMTGIELKERIDADEKLRKKSIPFVFYSTSTETAYVNQAYEYRVQGYFPKEVRFDAMKATLELIFNYWQKCKHPNS
jgi:CheY-like chemotaxis protein